MSRKEKKKRKEKREIVSAVLWGAGTRRVALECWLLIRSHAEPSR